VNTEVAGNCAMSSFSFDGFPIRAHLQTEWISINVFIYECEACRDKEICPAMTVTQQKIRFSLAQDYNLK